jgi:hypothetical protein
MLNSAPARRLTSAPAVPRVRGGRYPRTTQPIRLNGVATIRASGHGFGSLPTSIMRVSEAQRDRIKELRRRHDQVFRRVIEDGLAAGIFTVTSTDTVLQCMHVPSPVVVLRADRSPPRRGARGAHRRRGEP